MWPRALLLILVQQALACDRCANTPPTPALSGFGPAHPHQYVANATFVFRESGLDAEACARRCLSAAACIAFSWDASQACVGSGWSPSYAMAPSSARGAVYHSRLRAANANAVRREVQYALQAPTGGVALGAGALKDAFDANLAYLAQFPLDDMLYW